MRTILAFAILALLFLLIRWEINPITTARELDPVLLGYGTLFAAGIVAAELLRPLLSLLSGPVRFMSVAVLAAVVWAGIEYVSTPATTDVTLVSSTERQSDNSLEIPLSWDGHFRSVAQINGVDAGVLVDTGASLVLLRYDEAKRIGIDVGSLDYSRPISTAGGRIHGALLTLDHVKMGRLDITDVKAAVAKKGDLQSNLIGLSYLNRLKSVRLQNEVLHLQQ